MSSEDDNLNLTRATHSDINADISSSDSSLFKQLSINNMIGEGQYAQVYRLDNGLGEEVAVKRMTGRQKSILKREAEILKQLYHPNIVKYIGYIEGDTASLLLEEYFEGKKLLDMIFYDTERLNCKNIISISLQVALVLEYLHSRYIIYHDLNLSNVLVSLV